MNIVVDGYNICYKTTGTGDKTVVILQGWGTDLGVYDSVAGVIDGSRYRVIQFEHRMAWLYNHRRHIQCRL